MHMNWKMGIRKIVWSPFFIPTIALLLLMTVIPFPFNQFELVSIFKNPNQVRTNRIYADINNDGETEFIRFRIGLYNPAESELIISKNRGELLYQTLIDENFGTNLSWDQIIVANMDDEHMNEIGFFTHKNDSLFLFVFSYSDSSFKIAGQYITNVPENEASMMPTRWLGVSKVKGEMVLYFMNDGSKLKKRSRIYAFNSVSGEISEYSFRSFNPEVSFVESVSDDVRIYISTVSGIGVEPSKMEEAASESSLIIGLDAHLQKLFEPLVLADSGAIANMVSTRHSESALWVALRHVTADGNQSSKLLKFDISGKKLFEKKIPDEFMVSQILNIYDRTEDIYLRTEDNRYLKINPKNGEITKPLFLSSRIDGLQYITTAQLDGYSGNEHLFYDDSQQTIKVFRSRFLHSSSLQLTDDEYYFDQVSIRHSEGSASIVIPGEMYITRLLYRPTFWIWMKYVIWSVLYGLFILIIWIRGEIRQKKILESKSIERKITDLQLQNFRNQLDPHFTFNALNVIGSVIYKENRDVAYDLFTRFSRLMRASLTDSTRITRDLEAELQFTTDYLEFQNYRFKDKFGFTVQVDANVDLSMQVPKMLVQGYAENAIRHGFFAITFAGEIKISVIKNNDEIIISISDNGIGMSKAESLQTGRQTGGRGMAVMKEQIELFNKYNDKPIKILTDDLIRDAEFPGTVIRIIIPIGYRFSIVS